jgi:hypothetical protein
MQADARQQSNEFSGFNEQAKLSHHYTRKAIPGITF